KGGPKFPDHRLKEISDYWNEAATVSLNPGDIQVLSMIADKRDVQSRLIRFSTQIMSSGVVNDEQFSNPDTSLIFGEKVEDFSRLKVVKAGQLLTVSQARQKLLN